MGHVAPESQETAGKKIYRGRQTHQQMDRRKIKKLFWRILIAKCMSNFIFMCLCAHMFEYLRVGKQEYTCCGLRGHPRWRLSSLSTFSEMLSCSPQYARLSSLEVAGKSTPASNFDTALL